MNKTIKYIGLGAVIVFAVTNPFTVVAVEWALEIFIVKLIENAPIINAIAGAILLAFGVYLYRQATKTKIPAKGKKTSKAGAYIE